MFNHKMKEDNKLFLLTFAVIVCLLLLRYLPPFTLFGETVRVIDILSSVRADPDEIISHPVDSPVLDISESQDSIPEGIVAIEDYAPADASEMGKFYASLDEAKQRNVRVMFYGDSFIEGDILTEALRENLQKRYGGQGVGFVDITSITSMYRTTIKATDKGWDSHHANDRRGFDTEMQGFNAKYFIPCGTATVQYECPTHIYPDHLASCSNATIYFTPAADMKIQAKVNDGDPQDVYNSIPDDYGKILSKSVTGTISGIEYEVHGSGPSRCYGVALEGTSGVSVDNMSLRGSNGRFLSAIPPATLQQFNKVRPYDMIVILYGLNIAVSDVTDYSVYIDKMRPAIRNFHESYPDAAILLVGVSDRDERTATGKLQTMVGIKELVSYQRKLAKEEHIAFWDLRMAMGGDLSINELHKQGMASSDYVHINFKGGKFLAEKLFDALMYGKEKYDQRKQQDKRDKK